MKNKCGIIDNWIIAIKESEDKEGYYSDYRNPKDKGHFWEFIYEASFVIFDHFIDGPSDDLIDSVNKTKHIWVDDGYFVICDNIHRSSEISFFASLVINSKFELFLVGSKDGVFFKFEIQFSIDNGKMYIAIPSLIGFHERIKGWYSQFDK